MRHLLSALIVCWAVLASPLQADEVTRADLIAQIEAGGRNETSEERHAVEVDGCTLTTFRWMHVEGKGWVLWTSFTLPMATVDLIENSGASGIEHYVTADTNPPLLIIPLEAQEGTSFMHEKPFQRTPKGKFERSPRGDGTTHYIEERQRGFILHQGEDVRAKAEMFTKGYIRYVREYCTFTG